MKREVIFAVLGLFAALAMPRVTAQYQPSPGLILFVDTGSCPNGYTQVNALNGAYILGTVAANGDAGTTGGSSSYTPAGTNSAPSFSGSAGTVPAQTVSWPVSVPSFAGTAGTVPAEIFTGSSDTTSGTSAGTPAGTNGTRFSS